MFFFLQADIFSSKFVYFPVCTEGHWCLLVSVLKSLNYLPLIIGVFSDFNFQVIFLVIALCVHIR